MRLSVHLVYLVLAGNRLGRMHRLGMPYVNGFQPFLSGDFQVQTYLVQRPIQGCLKLFGSLGER